MLLYIWLIKRIQNEQDFGHSFFDLKYDMIMPQISDGEIAELLESTLPVSRHS